MSLDEPDFVCCILDGDDVDNEIKIRKNLERRLFNLLLAVLVDQINVLSIAMKKG